MGVRDVYALPVDNLRPDLPFPRYLPRRESDPARFAASRADELLSAQIAVGSCFGPCISCCATYFLVRRSLVIGAATAGAGLGAVILPIMLNKLFPILGFGPTIRAGEFSSLF